MGCCLGKSDANDKTIDNVGEISRPSNERNNTDGIPYIEIQTKPNISLTYPDAHRRKLVKKILIDQGRIQNFENLLALRFSQSNQRVLGDCFTNTTNDNIATYYKFWLSNDKMYFCAEIKKYAKDFDELLHEEMRESPFTKEKVFYYSYQICNALAALHGWGIAHRDLKPKNILVDDNYERKKLKVTAFGFSVYNNSNITLNQDDFKNGKAKDIRDLGVIFCKMANDNDDIEPGQQGEELIRKGYTPKECTMVQEMLHGNVNASSLANELLGAHNRRREERNNRVY